MKQIWLFRIAILWFIFFSFDALLLYAIASLTNVDWFKLTPQAKVVTIMIILKGWFSTMLAYFTKAAKKIEDGELPIGNGNGNTTHITKDENKLVAP